MVTTIIIGFFAASSVASVVVFAACAASARADEIQRQAFSQFYEEGVQQVNEKRSSVATTGQLALNP